VTFFSGYARDGKGAIADPYTVKNSKRFEQF
jgi:hypothetical protein